MNIFQHCFYSEVGGGEGEVKMYCAWSPTKWLSPSTLWLRNWSIARFCSCIGTFCIKFSIVLQLLRADRCISPFKGVWWYISRFLCLSLSLSDYSWAICTWTNHNWAHPFCHVVTPLCLSSLHLSLQPLWSSNALWQLLEDISTHNCFSVTEITVGMSEGGYPSVFMVDTHATTRPPLPPRLNQGRRRAGAAQTLLIMLVSLALCGMAIEACFIYHLYQPESVSINAISQSPPAHYTFRYFILRFLCVTALLFFIHFISIWISLSL